MLNQLREYVDAAFTALWVQTHEPDEAMTEIRRMAADNGWNLLHWDAASGLNGDGNGDPLAAVNALPAIGNGEQTGLVVFRNFHRFLNDIQVVQALANAVTAGKLTRSFAVVLSPIVEIPVELEKLFVVIEHELPSKDTLTQIAQQVGTEPGDLPEDLGPVVDAANGLTRYEAEGVYSLSLARHGLVRPDVVWDLKAQAIAKTGLARIHKGGQRVDDLGGNLPPSRSRPTCPRDSFWSGLRGPARARSPKPWATRWACPRSSPTWGVSWARWSARPKSGPGSCSPSSASSAVVW